MPRTHAVPEDADPEQDREDDQREDQGKHVVSPRLRRNLYLIVCPPDPFLVRLTGWGVGIPPAAT